MERYYSDNQNHQILLSLLKAHQIRKVIASPGGTNAALVASFQYDDFFEVYSCVDERSAAYMACGMAEESAEPVVICCTGATASRNYYPALTEAYYRKLPIVVLTCSRTNDNVGQLMPQVTDRSCYPNDIFICGEQLKVANGPNSFANGVYKVNKVLVKVRQRGGGPVHLNIETITQRCSTRILPNVIPVKLVSYRDEFPHLPKEKIGIFIGSHKKFDISTQKLIEKFCETYNAVVLGDHTSGYYGKYKIQYALIGSQKNLHTELSHLNLLIHLGEVSGDYYSLDSLHAEQVWRVNEDGEVRYRFSRLDYLFDLDENTFFSHYINNANLVKTDFYLSYRSLYDSLLNRIPELPLSHLYIAQKLATALPENAIVHTAIMNALRAWNFFDTSPMIRTNCNVGGFGIDGCMSSLIGASILHPEYIYYGLIGDLAFFYDMNSLGNRHIGPNVRIILVNDNGGTEFRHTQWNQYEVDVNEFIAGSGHFGNQSKTLVKSMAESLGFNYIPVNDKKDLDQMLPALLAPEVADRPLLMEVFTTPENQSDALEKIVNLVPADNISTHSIAKKIVEIGSNLLDSVKKAISANNH